MVEDHVVYKGPVPDGYKATRPFNTWDTESPLAEDEVYLWFLEEDREAPESVLRNGRILPAGFAISKTRKMRFDREILARQQITPDKAFCVEVRGNSMDPVLPSGSIVAVNTQIIDADDGRMYAVAHRGRLRVKLMHSLPGYSVRLRSYNRDEHPDEDYSLTESMDGNLMVIGRVFWYAAVV
jgi:phage repressor protein C with HTH and peptisase S24 domain